MGRAGGEIVQRGSEVFRQLGDELRIFRTHVLAAAAGYYEVTGNSGERAHILVGPDGRLILALRQSDVEEYDYGLVLRDGTVLLVGWSGQSKPVITIEPITGC